MRIRLPQTAVYWPPAGADGFGRPALGAPIQYACRWEGGYHQTVNSEGAIVTSTACVFLQGDIQIKTGGRFYKGLLIDTQASSFILAGNPLVHEILNVDKTPSLSGRQYLIEAHLT